METNHGKLAAELFLKGYNCSQSVVVAFSDVPGMTPRHAARISSSFGGGMGRMREGCGAVSGVLLVAGLCVGALSCVLSKALFAAMPKNAPGRGNQYKLFKK